MEQQVVIMEQRVVIIDANDLKYAIAQARAHNVAVEQLPQRGLDPVTTVTLIVIGSAAAVAMVASLLDRRKGGQIIDLRSTTPKAVYRSSDVAYGLIVLICHDDTVALHVYKPETMFSEVRELALALSDSWRETPPGEVRDVVGSALAKKPGVAVISDEKMSE